MTPEELVDLLAVAPASTGLVIDFDGTIAPIVDDPEMAAPLPGFAPVLGALASKLMLVCVLSGRPARFLQERLRAAGPRLGLIGLYGMEHATEGAVTTLPGADRWREVVSGAQSWLKPRLPEGIRVESKGLALALHWRGHPGAAGDAALLAGEVARSTGLVAHRGKMSVELRPPIQVDKGVVVTDLLRSCSAGCFVGDDEGDLAAFDAIDRLATQGLAAAKVAVRDPESSPALLGAADLVIDSPGDLLDLLRALTETL